MHTCVSFQKGKRSSLHVQRKLYWQSICFMGQKMTQGLSKIKHFFASLLQMLLVWNIYTISIFKCIVYYRFISPSYILPFILVYFCSNVLSCWIATGKLLTIRQMYYLQKCILVDYFIKSQRFGIKSSIMFKVISFSITYVANFIALLHANICFN